MENNISAYFKFKFEIGMFSAPHFPFTTLAFVFGTVIVCSILGYAFAKGNTRIYAVIGFIFVATILIYLYVIRDTEAFTNSSAMSAPVNYNMNMAACTGGIAANDPIETNCPYSRSPCYAPLATDVSIYSPVGDAIKLTSDMTSANFPTVDGTPNTPKQLFMLAHNITSPSCCPSAFSTDQGCVCLTKEQRDFINGRGANRTASDDF
jgi:hypothetical protein